MTDSADTLNVPPVILKSSTYLPMRDMGEKVIGKDYCKVGWDAATRTASYTFEYKNVYFKMMLPVDKTTVTLELKDGTGKIHRDNVVVKTAATIYQGRTVVPVRMVSELLGAKVDYEAATKTVTVYFPEVIAE
jgi:HJR/Mrr/RecB family endonuclease